MDAYSVSYTSPSRRNSSRIYQDLKTIRLQSLVQLEPEQLVRSLQILQQTGDVSSIACKDYLLWEDTRLDETVAKWRPCCPNTRSAVMDSCSYFHRYHH